jgi:hypothetical protein
MYPVDKWLRSWYEKGKVNWSLFFIKIFRSSLLLNIFLVSFV